MMSELESQRNRMRTDLLLFNLKETSHELNSITPPDSSGNVLAGLDLQSLDQFGEFCVVDAPSAISIAFSKNQINFLIGSIDT